VDNVSEKEKAEYAQLLETRSEMTNPPPTANRYPWQGELAIRQLLANGRAKLKAGEKDVEVCILTGSTPDRVYGSEAPDVWKEFLDAGGHIRVLAWTKDERRCGGVLKDLSQSNNQEVEFRISGTDELAGRIMHFVLVGAEDYRLEASHRPFDKSVEFTDIFPEVPARICFKNAEDAGFLKERFDNFWKYCHPLSD